jgi:hypothetical protein
MGIFKHRERICLKTPIKHVSFEIKALYFRFDRLSEV